MDGVRVFNIAVEVEKRIAQAHTSLVLNKHSNFFIHLILHFITKPVLILPHIGRQLLEPGHLCALFRSLRRSLPFLALLSSLPLIYTARTRLRDILVSDTLHPHSSLLTLFT